MSTSRRQWLLDRDVEIEALLHWCLSHRRVDRLLLTARLEQDQGRSHLLHPGVEDAIDRLFGPYILSRAYSCEWPGTRLIGHDGLVITVAFSSPLIQPMKEMAPLLREWRHSHSPPLPEDLCLFRRGDTLPTLVSVTHEERAWLLTDQPAPMPGEKFTEWDWADYIRYAPDFVGP